MIYVEIDVSAVPLGVRFDVPGQNAGQFIEVAYGGFCRGEHAAGDPYRRVLDRSTHRVTYARRA